MNSVKHNLNLLCACRRYLLGAGVGVVLVIHAALFCWIYSPGHFVRNTIPVNVDTTRYFSNMASVAGVGGLHGYDPYQMAGYPAGLWNSMGKKGFELARWIFPGVSLERRFYLTLLAVGGIAPIIFGFGFARFFHSRPSRLLWAIVLLLYWHLETHIAYFWHVGNVFFPAGTLLMVALLLACWKLALGYATWKTVLVVGLGGALLFYVHTILMVPLAISAAGFAGWSAVCKQWTLRRVQQVCRRGGYLPVWCFPGWCRLCLQEMSRCQRHGLCLPGD